MGLFDKSSSSNVTNLTENTSTNTQQTDQSGNQGFNFSNVPGSVGLTFQSSESLQTSDQHNTTNLVTDLGALAAGKELGLSGIDAAAATSRDAIAAVGGANASALSATQNATAGALAAVRAANADSLNILAGLASGSIDASKTIARDAAATAQNFVQQATSGFASLATQNSQTADDRITKVVTVALVAVAAVLVLPAIFRGGGAARAVVA